MAKKVAKPTKIPTMAECVQAGTHMERCTADGYCKVCFEASDFDRSNLVVFATEK